MTTPRTFLIDGPECRTMERRAALVATMAEILQRAGCTSNADDAHRLLHSRGFNTLDVMLLADDARQKAAQAAA